MHQGKRKAHRQNGGKGLQSQSSFFKKGSLLQQSSAPTELYSNSLWSRQKQLRK